MHSRVKAYLFWVDAIFVTPGEGMAPGGRESLAAHIPILLEIPAFAGMTKYEIG